MLDQEVDSCPHVGFFEERLAQGGVVHELLGDRVGHDGGVGGAVEEVADLLDDSLGKVEEDHFDGFAEAPGLAAGILHGEVEGVDWFDPSEGVGIVGQPLAEADPADAMEDEVGTAVGLFAGGTDQPGGANRGGAVSQVFRLITNEPADAEDAVAFEGVVQHPAVTVLEDVEGQGPVGEEGAIGQENRSDPFGKVESGHGENVSKGRPDFQINLRA